MNKPIKQIRNINPGVRLTGLEEEGRDYLIIEKSGALQLLINIGSEDIPEWELIAEYSNDAVILHKRLIQLIEVEPVEGS